MNLKNFIINLLFYLCTGLYSFLIVRLAIEKGYDKFLFTFGVIIGIGTLFGLCLLFFGRDD